MVNKMTSHELAKKLLSMPDIPIVTDGYEGGYYEIKNEPKQDSFHLNVNDDWYYGQHEKADHYNCEGKCEVKEMIYIG